MAAESGFIRSVLPWLLVVLAIVLAGGGYVALDRRISALQAASTVRETPPKAQSSLDLDQAKQALASLEETVKSIQAGQQKLAEQIAGVQRGLDSEGGERKMLSDQLGALSARVDALASAQATANSQAPASSAPPASTPSLAPKGRRPR